MSGAAFGKGLSQRFCKGKFCLAQSIYDMQILKFVLRSVAAKTSTVLFDINRLFKWHNTLSLVCVARL